MEVKKVLLVDDSQPFNFLSGLTLKAALPGCTVVDALNGKAALDILAKSEECPDVILLDINMPVMDGFEFLEEFERKSKCFNHSKVFMLTSSVLEEDRQAAMSFKFIKGYFSKPLTEEQIREIQAS